MQIYSYIHGSQDLPGIIYKHRSLYHNTILVIAVTAYSIEIQKHPQTLLSKLTVHWYFNNEVPICLSVFYAKLCSLQVQDTAIVTHGILC